MAERLGREGFVALAPDLYHGELAGHTEMDKAAQLMTALPPDRAARDMSGAVDFLAGHDAVTSDGIGVVGFCMGGMLSFLLADEPARQGEGGRPVLRLPAGRRRSRTGRSWRRRCAGTWRRTTTSSVPTAARALEAKLQGMGKDVHVHGPPRHRPRVHGPAQRARHPQRGARRADLARGRRLPARPTGLARRAPCRRPDRCSCSLPWRRRQESNLRQRSCGPPPEPLGHSAVYRGGTLTAVAPPRQGPGGPFRVRSGGNAASTSPPRRSRPRSPRHPCGRHG